MNRPDDIVMIFGNPIKCTHPIDQAKLIKKKSEISSLLEEWLVEYLNDPERKYTVLIKKTNGEDKK